MLPEALFDGMFASLAAATEGTDIPTLKHCIAEFNLANIPNSEEPLLIANKRLVFLEVSAGNRRLVK